MTGVDRKTAGAEVNTAEVEGIVVQIEVDAVGTVGQLVTFVDQAVAVVGVAALHTAVEMDLCCLAPAPADPVAAALPRRPSPPRPPSSSRISPHTSSCPRRSRSHRDLGWS